MHCDTIVPHANDSKKLSEKQRLAVQPIILDSAVYYFIAVSDIEVINKIGIRAANKLDMLKCAKHCSQYINDSVYTIFDGNRNINFNNSCSVIKGDSRSQAVACASILAKNFRDNIMIGYAEKYPLYAFDKHKGYVNDLHIEKIKQYGIIDGLYRIHYNIKALAPKQFSIFDTTKPC